MKERIKKKELILLGFFGLYFAALLWLTLLSRERTTSTSVLPPFWSYVEIFKGNLRSLYYVVANVLLFVPFGFFVAKYLGKSIKRVLIFGLFTSALIEFIQLGLKLGSFEVDDLVHNTLGAVIGLGIFHFLSRKKIFCQSVLTALKTIVLIVSCLVFCLLPIGFKYMNSAHMQKCAEKKFSPDGKQNLLVLNGEWGFVGNSRVFVYYSLDGDIHITGSSDVRAWKKIGEIELEPGEYYVSGLSGVESQSFTLEFEVYDVEQQNFYDVTSEIGAVSEDTFVLEKRTKINVYVGVYPNSTNSVTASPIICEVR